MTNEEKAKKISESELEAKIVIEFRKEGLAIDTHDVTADEIIMAAVTLLNQALSVEDAEKFVQLMSMFNKVGKQMHQKDEKDE